MKEILVGHYCGDGANFLIGCLSMSDDIYYRGFTKKEKLLHFLTKIYNKNDKWIDPNIWTCCFGNKILKDPNFKYYLNKQIDKKFIFKLEYNFDQRIKIDKFISQETFLILFKNPVIFFCLRNFFNEFGESGLFLYDVDCYPYGFYPKDDFLNKLSVNQYIEVQQDHKILLEEKYNMLIPEIIKKTNFYCKTHSNIQHQIQLFEKHCNYVWDVNWYLSEKDTLNNIEKLYNILGLSGYDEKVIKIMYEKWIGKINSTKEKLVYDQYK
jgi:hypothetical protein